MNNTNSTEVHSNFNQSYTTCDNRSLEYKFFLNYIALLLTSVEIKTHSKNKQIPSK